MYSIKSGGYCTQLRLIISFLFVLIFSLYSNQFARANPQSNIQQTEQQCSSSISKIETSKAHSSSPLDLSTLEWHNLKTLPDSWQKRWPDYHDSVWYRITWDYSCPTTAENPITLFIDHMNTAGEVYINDEFLWSDQLQQTATSRSWFMPRHWILPPSSLNIGKNTVTIRVVGSSTQNSGLGAVELGNYHDVMPRYKNALLEKRTLPLFNLMINLIISLFCFLTWVLNYKKVYFFWFSLVSMIWVIYVALTLYPDPIFSLSNTAVNQIHVFFFCLYVVVGCIAAWRFARRSYPLIETLLWLYLVVITLVLMFVPEAMQKQIINLAFATALIIFLAKCISYPFIAYQAKVKEVYLLAICYLFYIPIAVNDAYYMTSLNGQVLSPYTAPITSIFFGLLLSLRIAKNQKTIEKFNKTLEEMIIQSEYVLTKSLRSQYELSLENVKLQERMNLSHDLHDGIGGSIVRSMILVNKSEKVEKPQIMSILKLLRNDLRQVIDSSSSLGAKTPETPVLWIAPIRHRFIQFFEEFEVKSTWLFLNEWILKPSPIQSLTLARVTEEALNNVVKHSKATEVKISLHAYDHTKLVLEIQDNGIGFDLNTIQKGFHVGLHSMQIRVERIGAIFEVESELNNTIIRVTIEQ